jgi:hypothetical protein
MDHYPCDLKHVVVVGGGIIGLYAGIRLKQSGVFDITVVDPRLGIYTRPGSINNTTTFFVVQVRAKSKREYTRGYQAHLKDVERNLYQDALDLGIHLIQEEFVTFSNRNIQLKDQKGNIREIPCDLAFDCTGSKRAVIKEVNRLHEAKPPFTIRPVAAEVPVKTHLALYVRIPSKDLKILKNNELSYPQDKQFFTGLAKLHEFSWEHYAGPSFYVWNHGSKDKMMIYSKAMIYCETPHNLPREQQEDWLKAVIALKSGRSDIQYEKITESRKYGNKPTFMAFTVDPQKIVESHYPGDANIPLVFPGGDAQIEPEYRIGVGIVSGMSRMDAMIDNFVIDHQGVIKGIAFIALESALRRLLNKHQEKLVQFYHGRSERLEQGIDIAVEHYKQYEAKLTGLSTVEQEIQTMRSRLAEDLYLKAEKKLNSELEDNKVVNDAELLVVKRWLMNAFDLSELEMTLHKNVAGSLLFTAKKILSFAAKFYNAEEYKESELYYQEALNIYLRVFPGAYLNDVATLYINLMFIAKQNNRADQVSRLAEEAIFVLGKTFSDDKIIGKIRFNQTIALLNEASRVGAKKNIMFNEARVYSCCRKIITLLPILTNNVCITDADYKRMCSQYLALLDRYDLKDQLDSPPDRNNKKDKSNRLI